MVLPRHSHVERSIDIAAPRATVFVLVDGFKQFNKWSPWAAQDPNARYTIEGPEFGVGAKQSWVGDPKTVGRGSQEIVDVKPMESVTSRLDFGEEGTVTATMLLAPAADGTRVTWSLETDNGAGPIGRWFGLMMDRWIGPDYENGLANLKKLAESLPKADFADLAVTIVEVKPATAAYLPSQSSRETAAMGEALGAAFTKIVAFMKAEGLGQAGPPTAINTRWDDAGYGFDAAIPVDKPPSRELPPEAAVKVRRSYGGKALRIVSKGPYGGMPPDYDKLLAFMAARGYESAGPSWDEYISDPGKTPELELITNFYQPVK
jgi:effector-binding domain-containing protein/uncharacterized protein YndB with AHSA1/START domain